MVNSGKKTLKIISAYDPDFEALGAISSKSIALYSALHGCDFEVFRNIDFDRPAPWAKIRHLIDEVGRQRYEYILWVDADACFVRGDRSLLAGLAGDKDIWMVNHLCTLFPFDEHPGLFMQSERPNTGVLLVKTSAWSLEFLERVWDQTEYINHFWWEQAAFHKLMGFNFEITNGKMKNQPVPEVMEHIGWLDDCWNCVPTSLDGGKGKPVVTNSLEPVIMHFAGMKRELRLNEMRSLSFKGAFLR
jgi:hypothetical protein